MAATTAAAAEIRIRKGRRSGGRPNAVASRATSDRGLTVFCCRCDSPLPMSAACAIAVVRLGFRPITSFFHPSCLP
jgi:hypothetical protein